MEDKIRAQLQKLKEELAPIIQSDECDPTIRAWAVGALYSLCLAADLGYEEDTFHKRGESNKEWAKEVLVKILMNDCDPSIPIPKLINEKEDRTIWLRGYYYNSALMRMAALKEKGLKILLKRVNEVRKPHEHIKLIELVKDYLPKLTTLDRVRTQVNAFKHDHLSRSLKKIDRLDDACKAFSELILLLNLTVVDRTVLAEK